VAPRNDVEQRLATIWGEMLGIDQISVYDNFFELGGDSVKAIQISVKINEAGLQFTPQQLFQSQTIAELAAALDPSQAELTTSDTTDSSANGNAISDVPLSGFSQQELEKIAMLLEETDETDELNEMVE
jgi:acyl carrier protein